MGGVGMDKSNLKAEKTASRFGVDQLGTGGGKVGERRADVVHAIGDVVHAGATLREELADRRVRAGRSEQLDPALANEHGCRFDTLIGELIATLEPAAEELLVGRDRLIEIDDSESEVVDTERLHRARS